MSRGEERAVIWDMDGTLVDTAELHFQAWKTLAEQLRYPFSREDFMATFGRRNPEIIHQLFGTRFNNAEVAEIGVRKEELYRAVAGNGVSLLAGVRELLVGLQAAGYKQAIGSSAPRDNLTLILRLTEAEAFFDAIVSMEDTQRGKPDPEVFLIAAAKLAISPEHCVVIEDAVAGVQAARAAGMKCIAVRSVGHHPEVALRQAGADLVVTSLEEVSVPTVGQLLATGQR